VLLVFGDKFPRIYAMVQDAQTFNERLHKDRADGPASAWTKNEKRTSSS